ncbi:MAG: NAD(P)/FAD-dependent oxidoreductase [Cyanobacteria bacterium Co-bin8]|nr:NAD(P)/FAD-dependent oxidoreductase [Cyanobacteria bacterium Co-bin8]
MHQVVIVGGGFGGLYAAQQLRHAPVKVTLIDRRNFHLFQPLLYQVATGGLSPGDIASPLRAILSRQKNTSVLLGDVIDIEPEANQVRLKDGSTVPYDSLIVATGVSHHYFGNEAWAQQAPGIKTVEDALEVRRRIFLAFEAAEKETDPAKRAALLTFVVVGGGPTGVELAGSIADLAYLTLKEEFRNIDTGETRILLLEGMDRVLPPFPPELSAAAEASLKKAGVIVQTQTLVTKIEGSEVTMRRGDSVETIEAGTILWAAGVRASKMGSVLAEKAGAPLDRVGRVLVESDLSLPDHPNIFVVGDLANFAHQGDKPLPGVAPVAMQEGKYVAKLIKQRLADKPTQPFQYRDGGSLAIIGRNSAVVNLGKIKMSGFPAWLLWVFVHIYYLIEFDNKLVVMTQWGWNYFTRNQGSRLITGRDVEKTQTPAASISSVL